MSAPPYMKLFWGDYHRDTRHLTRGEHGAYFLLIGEAFNRGGTLPDDDLMLARWALSTPEEWTHLKPVVMAFFALGRSGWKHKRVAEELVAYNEVSRKRKAAGKVGGSATRGKDSEIPEANAQAIAQQKPTKPEPELEPVREIGGGGERERASQSTDWPEGDGQQLAKLLVEACASPWLDPAKSLKLNTTLGRLLAWKREGASWALDVVPVVTGLCAFSKEPVGSWTFFDKAIARSIASNRAALEIPDGRVVPLRPAGQSITDRIAAENAEARRLAFEMLDKKNG